MTNDTQAPNFTKLIDLAAERFGGKVLWCTDDFFAAKENLIKPEKAIFIPEKFTERGKWMDGWESRRKRTEGHDEAVIQLGAAGVIKGFDVDTAHFLGNQPQYCTIDACYAPDGNWEKAEWVEVLGKTVLNPGSQHLVPVHHSPSADRLFTHVKLHIYPDGGVARLRVYGEVQRDWTAVKADELIDLASAQNGALSIQCNDMFFSHMNNLLMPGRGINMGDGWETKRNRTPNNHDWVIIRLAHKGILKKALIDTAHFKGNYPDSFTLEGCSSDTDDLANAKWSTIIERTKMQAHHEHQFEKEVSCNEPVTHVRLNIFPDGGVSRIRLWGTIA
ncbi:MAG: allantoicase [Flavobacteriales bacterium]|nr:allantoicase [Flavobacteriales bacterium]MBK6943367.1 allantoicase [Flavobacteriales bacterium]MBK7240754.1 allantoicase [Flavobacteriales bacterium]MBK7296633.1 allantoicase [Flavobacteriales bacterium]MBK9536101.1 allantoicase [Flavobacteriales bacterium]